MPSASPPADEPGYFGLALTQRNVIAVTGACMLMRREVFEEIGRFDEAHSVINNDLDFCLRAHRAGKLIVFTPHASLIHHELASRERLPDVFDTSAFQLALEDVVRRRRSVFQPAAVTLFRRLPARRRAGADGLRGASGVRRGRNPPHPGGETGPYRRLRHRPAGDPPAEGVFPRRDRPCWPAGTRAAFAGMEPAIDEFIEFEFFHARSQLGERS